MRVAVDAMGGDAAPAAVVEGAVEAHREHGIESLLVGDLARVEAELERLGALRLPLPRRAASQRVEAGESPMEAFRNKPDSSLRVALEAVRAGEAQAFVSAGDTGAAFACAYQVVGCLKGVLRPAIATLIPTLQGYSIMLDVGANVDCRPQHLFQFGMMGVAYAALALGKSAPRLGLLNVGDEEAKGNQVTKLVHQMFRRSGLNFVGNVEGNALFQGEADVVVCDGFSGNIALKVSESLGEMVEQMLREQLQSTWRSRMGYLLLQNGLKSFRQRLDWSEYGGAPLLGLSACCIIAHGRSDAKAIKNAIRTAAELERSGLNERICREIEEHLAVQRSAERRRRLWHRLSDLVSRGEGEEETPPQPPAREDEER
ncbi:MAG: phosphate acyltransferase PlsX [Nitrospinota bacterium]